MSHEYFDTVDTKIRLHGFVFVVKPGRSRRGYDLCIEAPSKILSEIATVSSLKQASIIADRYSDWHTWKGLKASFLPRLFDNLPWLSIVGGMTVLMVLDFGWISLLVPFLWGVVGFSMGYCYHRHRMYCNGVDAERVLKVNLHCRLWPRR